MKLRTIELFGKSLFNLSTIDELVQFPTPMPENEAAFVYVLEGHCTNYTELEDFDLKKGQAILAKTGDGIFKNHEINGSSTFRAISIRLHKEVLEKLYQNETTPFFKKSHLPLTANSVMVKSNKLIEKYIESTLFYIENQELIKEDLIVLKLKELITILLQTEDSPKVIEIMSNLFEKRTFEFKEIIRSHLFSSLSINELAQLTNLSLSSFKKEFNRVYNDTPNNYLIGERIKEVAQLLLNSNESITNIAYDCEFKTLAHMSRVFKAKYGVSPSEYRLNFSDK